MHIDVLTMWRGIVATGQVTGLMQVHFTKRDSRSFI